MTDTEVTIPHTKTTEVKITYQGTDLVRAREAAGLTQAELALRVDASQQYIAKCERATVVTVHKETFDKFMEAIKKPRG